MNPLARGFPTRYVEELGFAAIRSARYSESQFVLFGWLSWLIPIGAIVDYIVGNPTFDTILVRTSAAFICIPLILHKKIPAKYKTHYHIYFVSVLAYIFPFTYGFMLSMNAATTPAGQEIHIIWILQYFVALFLFIQLVVDGSLATSLWLVSSFLALCPIILLTDPNTHELERVFVYPITGYVTALGLGIFTNRKTDIINSEKAVTASAIGANLAHELRTPLASIRAMSQGVANLLPVLTDAYNKAKASGIEVAPLRKSQVSQLDDTLASIRNEVEYSNTIIDMLLVNTADKPLSDADSDQFSVNGVIEEAIARYPFNNAKERELISVSVAEDFRIAAPHLLVIHVLFNLIKNGLYFVQKSGKGSIQISAILSDPGGQIIVHDTGTGIPASIRPHIFERFYTTTHTGQGAGIGLSFCHMVMESIGGSISCDSQDGEYTTFTLAFPQATG